MQVDSEESRSWTTWIAAYIPNAQPAGGLQLIPGCETNEFGSIQGQAMPPTIAGQIAKIQASHKMKIAGNEDV